MSYSNDYFPLQNHVSFMRSEFSGSHRRLRTPSYTFTGFHHWTHMYNKKYQVFHLRGVSIPTCYYPTHIFMFLQQCEYVELQLTIPAHSSNHQVWCLIAIMNLCLALVAKEVPSDSSIVDIPLPPHMCHTPTPALAKIGGMARD